MIDSEKSEFYVGPVIIGEVKKHENADTLSITEINGNPVIFRTGDYKTGDKAIYVSVDALVPTDKSQFAFLKKETRTHHRVKAMKLRGTFSMGLLVPIKGFEDSTDIMADLGITKYTPPSEREDTSQKPGIRMTNKGPRLPVYGLDPMRKYMDVLEEGEEVWASEKIHGCNSRYVYKDGKLWVGSHKTMRGCTRSRISELWSRVVIKIKTFLGLEHRAHLIASQGDVWWRIAEKYDFKNILKNHPNKVLYGEIFGKGIQDMEYGLDTIEFRAFDVYDLETNKYLDFSEFIIFCNTIGIINSAIDYDKEIVPILRVGPWNDTMREFVKTRAEGKSAIADHLIEGIVVKPVKERTDHRCGRVAMKYVGQNYLLRKTDD